MKTRKIKFICNAVRWFDRLNGNTYHSVRITRTKDGAVIAAPWSYGYDDFYKQTALELLSKEKWIKVDKDNLWTYEHENNYPIEWIVSEGLKRKMIRNGEI